MSAPQSPKDDHDRAQPEGTSMNAVSSGRRRLLAATALGATLSPWVVRAGTPGVDEPPLPGPAVPLVLPLPRERSLPNGLRVIVMPRRGAPLVTTMLVVRAGAERDAPGLAGMASLTATLLGRGAVHGGRAQDAVALAREAESLGGDLSLSSSFAASQAAMTVTTPKLPQALALLADVVRQPTFAAAEVERTRAESLDELRLRFSRPGAVASMAARRSFWGDSPYGASVTPASLQRIGRDGLRQFHAQTYRPDQAALVFAGDIDEDRAWALAQQFLGSWSRPAQPVPELPLAPPKPQAPAFLAIDMGDTGQSAVIVTAPYVATGADDRFIALMASAALGMGFSSRLSQEIRVKRGLAYGAFSSGESHRAGGMLLAEAQTKSASAGEVVGLMREELLRMGREPPAQPELDARRAMLLGSYGRQGETTSSLAGLVAATWVRGQPLADIARYSERLLAVTPTQVGEWAAARWTPQALRMVVAGDGTAAAAGLEPWLKGAQAWAGKRERLDFDRPGLVP